MPSLLPEPLGDPTKSFPTDAAGLHELPTRLSNEKSSVRSESKAEIGFPLAGGIIGENEKAGHSKTPNGVVAGGPYLVNSPLGSLANGRMSNGSYSINRSSMATDGERRSLEQQQQQQQQPPPSSSKEKDGQYTAQQGMNGKAVQPRSKGVESVAPPSPERTSLSAARTQPSVTLKTRHRRAQSASSPSASQGAVGSPLEPTKTEIARFSSPPIYDGHSSSSASNNNNQNSLSPHSNAGAPRLVHRHTLQVPKLVPTTRNSRDFSFSNGNPSEDAIASGYSSTSGVRRSSLNLGRRNTRSVHSELYMEDVPPDADAARWAETVKQKRASRRKRKEEEEDDRVMVGTKVDQHHVNWVTAYNMLTGIRFTVSRTNAKLDRELEDSDFDAKHKFSFDITGNELTPSAKYDFKFKDYAPWVFRHLRAKFHLDPADYLISLTSKYILSELGSPGKSGSFFYFSRDYKYIIKTIHHAEHKLLRKILRDYYAHIENNPNTLISQFYGLHRVKIPYGRKIHFVVMNNLFPPHRDIHQTFDLKGSTIGRDFKEEDLEKNPRATLKDLNWLRRNNHLELGPMKKHMFIEQMKRDVHLLQKLKIMDYSLLVGIHDISRGNDEGLRDKTLQVFQPGGENADDPKINPLIRTPSKLENARKARELRQIIKRERPVPMEQSTLHMPSDYSMESKKGFVFYSDNGGFQATHENDQPGEEIYYLGIIDCLTHYGFVKRLEHFWKGLSNNKTQISPIPPEGYGDRFVSFISGITMPREEIERTQHQAGPASRSLDRSSSIANASNNNRRSSLHQHHPPLTSTEGVMERAERQAEKSEKEGSSEEGVPERTLTVRSPSPGAASGHNPAATGVTLPVVEEVGESGSMGGLSHRSGQSRDEKNVPSGNGTTIIPGQPLVASPPPTRPPPTFPPPPAFAPPPPPPSFSNINDNDKQNNAATVDGANAPASHSSSLLPLPVGGRPPPTPPKDRETREVQEQQKQQQAVSSKERGRSAAAASKSEAGEEGEGGNEREKEEEKQLPLLPTPSFGGDGIGFSVEGLAVGVGVGNQG